MKIVSICAESACRLTDWQTELMSSQTKGWTDGQTDSSDSSLRIMHLKYYLMSDDAYENFYFVSFKEKSRWLIVINELWHWFQC
jgi:hypothetical protein